MEDLFFAWQLLERKKNVCYNNADKSILCIDLKSQCFFSRRYAPRLLFEHVVKMPLRASIFTRV